MDYAIVGYALECLVPEQRKQAMEEVVNNLPLLSLKWHASLSDFLTATNRLLSRCQPYAHAECAVASTINWLFWPDRPPFDPETNPCAAMMAWPRWSRELRASWMGHKLAELVFDDEAGGTLTRRWQMARTRA